MIITNILLMVIGIILTIIANVLWVIASDLGDLTEHIINNEEGYLPDKNDE